MEKMNQAFEKMKMLVGVEVDDESQASTANDGNSPWFMDDFNRNCTLSTKQVCCCFLGYNDNFDAVVAEFSSGSSVLIFYLSLFVLYITWYCNFEIHFALLTLIFERRCSRCL